MHTPPPNPEPDRTPKMRRPNRRPLDAEPPVRPALRDFGVGRWSGRQARVAARQAKGRKAA